MIDIKEWASSLDADIAKNVISGSPSEIINFCIATCKGKKKLSEKSGYSTQTIRNWSINKTSPTYRAVYDCLEASGYYIAIREINNEKTKKKVT